MCRTLNLTLSIVTALALISCGGKSNDDNGCQDCGPSDNIPGANGKINLANAKSLLTLSQDQSSGLNLIAKHNARVEKMALVGAPVIDTAVNQLQLLASGNANYHMSNGATITFPAPRAGLGLTTSAQNSLGVANTDSKPIAVRFIDHAIGLGGNVKAAVLGKPLDINKAYIGASLEPLASRPGIERLGAVAAVVGGVSTVVYFYLHHKKSSPDNEPADTNALEEP